MRRLLLVAVAAAIAVGGIIDATLLREFVGQASVGARERQQPDQVRASERSPLTLESMARLGSTRRYGVYLDIRDLAPGAKLVREADPAARDPLDATFLVALGSITGVVTAELAGLDLPVGPSVVETPSASGDWVFHLAQGRVPSLVVLRDGDSWHLVDARLFSEQALRSALGDRITDAMLAAPLRAPRTARSLGYAIAAEWAVHALLLLAGGLLLPRTLRAGVRLPIAYLVGVGLHGALGILLIPGAWGVLLTLSGSTLYAVSPAGVRAGTGWRRADSSGLVAAAAIIGALVTAVQWSRSLFLTADSFAYWAGGAALSAGQLGPSGITLKRGITLQALHAAGISSGSGGLLALGVVALTAGAVLILVHLVPADLAARTQASTALRPNLWMIVGGGAAVAGVVISPQVRTMAVYLNSHMLLAAAGVALVVLLGRAVSREDRRSLAPAVGALVAAIVMTRVEGIALVGLLLLGSLAAARTAAVWRTPWVVLGTTGLVWAAVTSIGGGVAPANVGIAAAGLSSMLVALAAPLLRSLRARAALLLSVGSAMWIVTLLLVRSERVRFVDAALANLGAGAGGWGVLAPMLLIAGILAVVHTADIDDPGIQGARWLLIGFVPVSLITKLGDGLDGAGSSLERLLVGGGRVGWGDSVNRMWTHAVLIVVLLLVVAIVTDDTHRRTVLSLPRRALDLGLLAGAVLVALQWQPASISQEAPTEALRILSVDGEDAVGELASGSEVRQRVLLPADAAAAVPAGHRVTAACLDVRLVSYGRGADGDLLIEVEWGPFIGATRIPAERIADWDWVRTCVEVPPDDQRDGWPRDPELDVVVSARGAPVDRSLSVLEAPAGEGTGFGAVATLVRDDGTVVIRRVGHLVVRAELLTQAPQRTLDETTVRVASILPWTVLLLGAGSRFGRWRR